MAAVWALWAGVSLAQDLPQPLMAQQADPVAPAVSPSPPALIPPPTLKVTRFQVDGLGTMITPAEVDATLQPYLQSQGVSFGELQKAADALTELLKQRGFFLARVFVPAQTPTDGVVQLKVLSGSVGKITVEGNEHYSSDFIKGRVEESLAADRTLREADLQRQLLLLNENSDLQATAVLQPGEEDGTTDVTVRVKDALPIHGGLNYDNLGTPFTNVHRLSPYVSLGNLATDGDNLNLRYLAGLPDNRASLLQAAYSLPVNRDGTRIGLAYANGASTLGQQLEVLDIRGRADIASLSVSHPLQRSLTQNQDVSLTYAYKRLDNSLLGVSTGEDQYHSLRFGYSGERISAGQRSLLQAALTQGVGGSSISSTRVGTKTDFTRLNLDITHLQELDPSFFVVVRGSGQYSADPLFVAEQFSLGGIDSVRGYRQSEFLGDTGYTLSAELRFLPWQERRDVQFSAFIDHGGATVRQPLASQRGSTTLTGAGVGLRFNVGPQAALRLDVGFPLAPADNLTNEHPVFYGQVNTRF